MEIQWIVKKSKAQLKVHTNKPESKAKVEKFNSVINYADLKLISSAFHHKLKSKLY